MRTPSARPLFLTGAAIGGAVLWGLTEFFALQWCRFCERIHARP